MPSGTIIAIANQKGGVGKTTTTVNLGAALAEAGHKVTLIDLDPQGNASTGLGVEPKSRELTSYDLILGEHSLDDVAVPTSVEGMTIAPGNADLTSADIDLSASSDRVRMLHRKLRPHAKDRVILIDCPPALGLLTLNAMVASDAILVPLQAEFFALEGLSQLLLTVKQVRQTANAELQIAGVLLTMSDARNNLAQQVEADARATLGDLVFTSVIPRNVRVSEAPSFAQSVLQYDKTSKGALAYRSLAAEFQKRMDLELEGA